MRVICGRMGIGFLAGTVLAFSGAPVRAASDDLAERARRLHAQSIVVDTHVDAPYVLDGKWADIAQRGATPHFDIPRAREGGVTAPFFAVYVPSTYAETGGATRLTLDLIDLVGRVVAAHPRDLVLASSVVEIRRAKKDGRIAVLMGIEGGHAIENSLGALRQFHRLGVRYMTLTHTNTNQWADATGPFYLPDYDPAAARQHGGLTDFGRQVVREMNRIGMMVDISHVSDDTIADVLEISRAPVFASHSSCRALCDIPRNLTDEQIRRIASGGGVVMINIGSYFLDQESVDAAKAEREKVRPEYERITKEHALKVGGPNAVGLGTDFDGIQDPPEGLEDVSMLPRITEELLRRGHSEDEVRGVLGENFLRFFSRVGEAAARLGGETPSTATIQTVPVAARP